MTIKLELEKASASTVTGGAMNVFGIACNDPEELAKMREAKLKKSFNVSDKEQMFTADCTGTFGAMLAAAQPEKDKKYRINCLSACVTSEAKVIGTEAFSPQSSVCKSAFYADILKRVDGGMFEIIIGGKQENYKAGSPKKNIVPEGSPEGTDWSVTIAQLEVPALRIKPDMEVDVFNNDHCWKRGVIKEKQKGKALVTVDGKEATYQLPDIKGCGARVKATPCKGGGAAVGPQPAKITFQLLKMDKTTDGYIADQGSLADFHGEFKYGWSNENELNCSANEAKTAAEPLTSAGCLFVPSKESAY